MRLNRVIWLAALTSVLGVSLRADVIKQQPGTNYLAFEAELAEVEGDPEFGGWIEVFPDEELESPMGNPILPEDSNVSGSAMFDDQGGQNFVDNLNYQLEFAEPGIYSVYLRYSMFDMQEPLNYANEDSFYFPLELDEPAEQDGWFSLDKQGHDDSLEDPPYWEGQFHWMGPFTFQTDEPVEYEVTQGDVGQALDFQISQRERGSTLDAIVFSTEIDLFEDELDELLESDPPVGITGDFDASGALDLADINALTTESASGNNTAGFDVTNDAVVDKQDVTEWIKVLANSWIGDANLDGEFNSGDLVGVFQAGKFEQEVAAVWAEGDWDGDGRFSSSDFVAAFQDGGFELGPRGEATASVPEPASLVLFALGLFCIIGNRRR